MKTTDLDASSLLGQLLRRWPLFGGMVLIALLFAIFYIFSRTPFYRLEANIASYSSEELERMNVPPRFEGPALLKTWVETSNSAAFRKDFLESLGEENFDSQTKSLFGNFSSDLAIKQMGDEYAIVSLITPSPSQAKSWLSQFISYAQKKTIDRIQLKEIRKARSWEAKEEYLVNKQIENIEKQMRELSRVFKETGQNIALAISPIHHSSDTDLGLRSKEAPLKEVVKFDNVIASSMIGGSKVLVVLYAFVVGSIAGVFAVMMWEFLSSSLSRLRIASRATS